MALKLNGKRYEIPSGWFDKSFTVAKYQRLFAEWDVDKPVAERDYFKLFCILSCTEFSKFHQTTENEFLIGREIKWFIESNFNLYYQSPFDDKPPKTFTFRGVEYKVEHPGELPIGRNIHLKDECKGIRYADQKIAIAIAIFLQPLITNSKFNIEEAREIAKEIEQLPAHEVRPLGFFLLNRAYDYGLTWRKSWLLILINLRESLSRTWQSWLKLRNLNPTQT